jgi:hypothetical protein
VLAKALCPQGDSQPRSALNRQLGFRRGDVIDDALRSAFFTGGQAASRALARSTPTIVAAKACDYSASEISEDLLRFPQAPTEKQEIADVILVCVLKHTSNCNSSVAMRKSMSPYRG